MFARDLTIMVWLSKIYMRSVTTSKMSLPHAHVLYSSSSDATGAPSMWVTTLRTTGSSVPKGTI